MKHHCVDELVFTFVLMLHINFLLMMNKVRLIKITDLEERNSDNLKLKLLFEFSH